MTNEVDARTAQLRAIAEEMGFGFFPDYDPRLKLSTKLNRFRVCHQNSNMIARHFNNIIVSREGAVDMTVMDFSFLVIGRDQHGNEIDRQRRCCR